MPPPQKKGGSQCVECLFVFFGLKLFVNVSGISRSKKANSGQKKAKNHFSLKKKKQLAPVAKCNHNLMLCFSSGGVLPNA